MTSLKIDKNIKFQYKFYGHEYANIKPINKKYDKIKDLYDLYDVLNNIWSKETCAPRMRKDWNINNKTLGQCSITSFLVQDIFGGNVYGIKLDDGNFHCYNVINNLIFDLTKEQFNKPLNYDLKNQQFKEIHFKNEEKYQRYLLLKNKLENYL